MTDEPRSTHSGGASGAARRTDPRGFSEEAFFFGPASAPLYAVLHAPAPSARAATFPPIVHIHSYGIEQVASYRIEVEFARAAAAAGFPVLRFHMRGAGDSFGEFSEMTIEGMVSDVVLATRLLAQRGLAGEDRAPILLGVRLGCDIAIRAASALGGVRALILWEPVADPRAYIESILRSRIISALAQGQKSGDTVASLVERLHRDGGVDVLGYPVHRRLYAEATPLAIGALPNGAPPARDALVVSIGKRQKPTARCAEIARRLEEAGARTEIRELREEAAWQFNSNPSFVSPALTQLTLSWVLGIDDARGATESRSANAEVTKR
ncbi:MAG: hypothetical protein ACKVU1_06525 [bacterium]